MLNSSFTGFSPASRIFLLDGRLLCSRAVALFLSHLGYLRLHLLRRSARDQRSQRLPSTSPYFSDFPHAPCSSPEAACACHGPSGETITSVNVSASRKRSTACPSERILLLGSLPLGTSVRPFLFFALLNASPLTLRSLYRAAPGQVYPGGRRSLHNRSFLHDSPSIEHPF